MADKLHSRVKFIGLSAILLAISWVLFIFIPIDAKMMMLVVVNFFIGVTLVYAIRSQYFADIDDAGIDVNMTGRVSGVLSTFGYLPDVFIFTMVGSWLDNFQGQAGYNMIFIFSTVMALVCAVVAFILYRSVKKDAKAQA